MKAYREVPHWWYFTMLGVNLVAAILMVWTTPLLQTPVWALLLALIIAAVSFANAHRTDTQVFLIP